MPPQHQASPSRLSDAHGSQLIHTTKVVHYRLHKALPCKHIYVCSGEAGTTPKANHTVISPLLDEGIRDQKSWSETTLESRRSRLKAAHGNRRYRPRGSTALKLHSCVQPRGCTGRESVFTKARPALRGDPAGSPCLSVCTINRPYLSTRINTPQYFHLFTHHNLGFI